MVNAARQWYRLMELAELGAIPGDGVNRACLTPLDTKARRRLVAWGREAGAEPGVDAAGNLWLRRPGTDAQAAPVLTGSHLDTQPAGGRFDGSYGVIAGLEVLAALQDAGIATRRAVELVAWTNEEGGRFAPGCMGSMAWSGARPLAAFAEARDADGVRFADALAAQQAQERDLPRRPLGAAGPGQRPHAYVEAHIEQGPLLEREGVPVGIVTGIQGSRWFSVTVTGESAHAGTTPLALRRDAVLGMVAAIEALRVLTHDPQDVLRFTVGRIAVAPNSSNSVASRAVFSVDLRHPDAAVLGRVGDAVAATAVAAAPGLDVAVAETFRAEPVAFDPGVVATIGRAAAAAGHPARALPSGAFHDAQFAAGVCPSGMIFVPCRGGVSHNPAEYASAAQLAAGTETLFHALRELAA